ncbi:O-antigen ligase family protein [Flagellimonas oceanensis]|uniref:O-antigen ligase family protein n=1 Tax=Flagellimonas oceanensis TaxID=2499163 RepID=UPI0013E01D70|nr:O-antigen ligase family protein [Allomuricauda oceanensis]
MRSIWSNALLSSKNQLFGNSILFFIASQFYGNALVSIALGLLIGMGLLKFAFDKKSRNIKKVPLLLLFFPIFFTSNFISAVINSYDFYDIGKAFKLLPFIYFPFIFLIGKKFFLDKTFREKCRKVYFFSATLNFLVLLFWALFRTVETGNFIFLTYNNLASVFGLQPIYLSAFYIVAVLFGVELFFKNKTNTKALYLIGSLILVIGVILLASRTSWIILIMVLPIKLYPFFKRKIIFWSLILSFGLIATSMVFLSPTLRSRLVGVHANVASYSGLDLRVKIWKNALKLIEEEPLFGYGMNNSDEALKNRYMETNFRRAYIYGLNTHNQYLQTCLDSGLISLLFLILIVFALPFFYKLDRDAILFIVIISLSLLTESYFRRFNGIIFFTFFYLYFVPSSIKKH